MNSENKAKSQKEAGQSVLVVAFAMVAFQAAADGLILDRSFVDTTITAVFALFATVAIKRRSKLAADVIAVMLVSQAIVLTASFRGHPWQLDTHMVYFVMLAVISTIGSIRSLILGACAIAVHHLVLTVAFPALVYPSLDLMNDIARTAFHGVLVVLEASVLILSMRRDRRMVQQITEQTETLSDQTMRAETAESTARRMMIDSEKAITALRANLHHLSERRLDCRMEGDMPEAFEDLRDDFNLAVAQLDSALGKALSMSKSFDGEAKLLSSFISELEESTRSQARDLGAQSEQVERLSARLEDSAQQAKRAADRVATAREEADRGGEITRQAVAAMERIEKSSGEVGNIMDLIDDIAFQTNLLALNAGVEAARAGASGRGFAVVAGEVQALSQRTAEAARGVKELISSSEEEVSSGAKLVQEAGRRLSSIVSQVNDVNELIEAIREDAGSRASETADLSRQMSDLDREAQSILRSAAEMSGSGDRLRGHAMELASVMSQFRVASDRSEKPRKSA